MCSLVIMCVGLALLGIETRGHVLNISDKISAESTGYQRTFDDCFSKCVPRCQQLVKASDLRCCNCTALCEKSCDKIYKSLTALSRITVENRFSTTPADLETPCVDGKCELTDAALRPLLASCGPCRSKRRPSRSPKLREAALIARSVGMNIGILDTGSGQEEAPSSDSSADNSQASARLESVVRGEDSVSAQVSWEPLARGATWYLVSWEPEGGGVRGNLLSNSTSASLSLWPDTVYHVQITSANARARTECLEVDTHTPPSSPQQFAHGTALLRGEGLAGAAAALMLFLAVLILLVRRWQNRHESTSKCVDQIRDCDPFKLYPPPVTLRHPVTSSPQLPV